jgi:hypothetical protein
MFKDIMGIVVNTEDKWLNKKLNSHICYKGMSEAQSIASIGGVSQATGGALGQAGATGAAPSNGDAGLSQSSTKVADARTKLEGALGSLQGLKDGSAGVCACGKRKGTCNCKGYSYGTDAAYADPVQEAEIASFQGAQAQINPGAVPPQGPSEAEQMAMGEAQRQGMSFAKEGGSQAFDTAKEAFKQGSLSGAKKKLGEEAGDAAFDAIVGEGGGVAATDATLSAANDAAAEATAKATGGLASSALSGMGGAAAADLLTKGKVDEKTLLKGGLAMGANMLLPGSGFLVGPAMSALGLQDGTMEVPPVGYADGAMGIVGMLGDKDNRDKLKDLATKGVAGTLLGLSDGTNYAQQDAQKASMSPEEYQMKFLKEKIEAPVKDFVEKRPMLQAPLLLAAAAKDYEKGDLNLGKYGGGRLTGGKDRLAYKHAKYGDFEINPESERVSYKKTFRF